MIMKNYHLYYDKEDIFMKKYMIPVIYLITRYVDNYDVNIMDFSDLIVLDDNVFKNMQEFIIKSLETSREKYQYFFDKIS
jgi:type III secretory pathway component EscR